MKTRRHGWRTKELRGSVSAKDLHCWGIWYGKDTAISDRAWIIIFIFAPIILPFRCAVWGCSRLMDCGPCRSGGKGWRWRNLLCTYVVAAEIGGLRGGMCESEGLIYLMIGKKRRKRMRGPKCQNRKIESL